MRNHLKFIFISFLLLLPFVCNGQAKIYTRKMMMQDFLTSTTKVVLSGNSPLELTVRNEMTSKWRVSPFEFCNLEDYEKLKGDNSFYFLRLVAEDGVAFISLEKGGSEDNPDRSRRPFQIIQFPISLAGYMTGDEIIYMGAFLDIIQDFAEKAMESDITGYTSFFSSNTRSMEGKTIYLDSFKANEVFQKGQPDALIPIEIVPPVGSTYYRMLISADTHEVFYFTRGKVNGMKKDGFTIAEMRLFERRHAEIAE